MSVAAAQNWYTFFSLNRYCVVEIELAYIFRAVRFVKKCKSYVLCPNRHSYSRARELIVETLPDMGVVSKGFSTLRAGGATFIAKNVARSDCSDRFLCAPRSMEIR